MDKETSPELLENNNLISQTPVDRTFSVAGEALLSTFSDFYNY